MVFMSGHQSRGSQPAAWFSNISPLRSSTEDTAGVGTCCWCQEFHWQERNYSYRGKQSEAAALWRITAKIMETFQSFSCCLINRDALWKNFLYSAKKKKKNLGSHIKKCSFALKVVSDIIQGILKVVHSIIQETPLALVKNWSIHCPVFILPDGYWYERNPLFAHQSLHLNTTPHVLNMRLTCFSKLLSSPPHTRKYTFLYSYRHPEKKKRTEWMCGVTEAKNLNTDALTVMNRHGCGPKMQQPWRSSSGLWESHPWLCALMLLSQSLSGSDSTTAARWFSKALKKPIKDCICFAAFLHISEVLTPLTKQLQT